MNEDCGSTWDRFCVDSSFSDDLWHCTSKLSSGLFVVTMLFKCFSLGQFTLKTNVGFVTVPWVPTKTTTKIKSRFSISQSVSCWGGRFECGDLARPCTRPYQSRLNGKGAYMRPETYMHNHWPPYWPTAKKTTWRVIELWKKRYWKIFFRFFSYIVCFDAHDFKTVCVNSGATGCFLGSRVWLSSSLWKFSSYKNIIRTGGTQVTRQVKIPLCNERSVIRMSLDKNP